MSGFPQYLLNFEKYPFRNVPILFSFVIPTPAPAIAGAGKKEPVPEEKRKTTATAWGFEFASQICCNSSNCVNSRQKAAFTLAEVLITLMILGTIAILVIPSAIQKANDRAAITQVKKVYSELDQAIRRMYIEDNPDNWSFPDEFSPSANNANHNYYLTNLGKYMAFQKICGSSTNCFNQTKDYYKTLNGTDNIWATWTEDNLSGKAILQNGMQLQVTVTGYSNWWDSAKNRGMGNYLGTIRIDINGQTGPNRYGYDVFFFGFSNQQLLPWVYRAGHSNWCKTTTSEDGNNGVSCSGWVLSKGNMDYKYRDVSAEW